MAAMVVRGDKKPTHKPFHFWWYRDIEVGECRVKAEDEAIIKEADRGYVQDDRTEDDEQVIAHQLQGVVQECGLCIDVRVTVVQSV